MLVMDLLVPRNLNCLRSLLMRLANKLPPPKVRLKVIQANRLKLTLSPNNLEHFLLHQMIILRLITPRILNSVTPTHSPTTITSSNMVCSKAPQVNKMAKRLKDRIVDTAVPNLTVHHLNSLKVQPNNPNHGLPLQVKVKPAVTLHRIRPLHPSNQEPFQEPSLSLSLAIPNNLKRLITHTVILTIQAHIMPSM